MSTNNALLPSDTYCPPEYVGIQAFLISMENLKKAYDSTIDDAATHSAEAVRKINAITFVDAALNTFKTTVLTSLGTAASTSGVISRLKTLKNNSATWLGGIAHSVMPNDVRESLKSKRFIVISWQDLNILINLPHEVINAGHEISDVYTAVTTLITTIINAAGPPTPDQLSDLTNLTKISLYIAEMRHNIHAFLITSLLNNITPVGIVTANTMVMNMDCTLKMPMNLDNFDSLSYQILKVRNINDVRIKSPYFKSSLTSKDGDLYTGFYYIVPKVEALDLVQLNRKSIDAANLEIKTLNSPDVFSYATGDAITLKDITTTMELEKYIDTVPINNRVQFPIYTKMDKLDTFTFGACIGKHVHRSFMDLSESNWFAFNPLNYRTVGIRLRSVEKRKITVGSVSMNISNVITPANTPFFNNPLVTPPGKKSSSKSSSRVSNKDDALL